MTIYPPLPLSLHLQVLLQLYNVQGTKVNYQSGNDILIALEWSALIKARRRHFKLAFIVFLSFPPCERHFPFPLLVLIIVWPKSDQQVSHTVLITRSWTVDCGWYYMACRGRQSTKIDCCLSQRRRATHSLIKATKKFDD